MAIRKIQMRPPGSGDYGDILYPKTSADIVTTTDNSNVQTVLTSLASGKSDTGHTHAKSDITDFPSLGSAASKNTGTSGGQVPILDSNGKLATSILPPLAITEPFVVENETKMLALAAQTGDFAIRTDVEKTFILAAEPASTKENWIEILTVGKVISVGGKTGVVTLTDLGLNNVTNESKATMFTSPAFTGIPVAPTAGTTTNNTQIATTAFVKSLGYLSSITKAMVENVLTGVINTHSHTGLLPGAHAASHITGGTDAIQKASTTQDGLMSKEDKVALNGKAAATHTHTKSNITDFPTAVSSFNNDAGYITKTLTIGTVKPSDGTLWFEEIS